MLSEASEMQEQILKLQAELLDVIKADLKAASIILVIYLGKRGVR